jgi:phosphate starvation-inducible protein PhoH and related proteins
MTEATIALDDPQRVLSLFGARDQHLRTIRDTLGTSIVHRDGAIRVAGEESAVAKTTQVFEQLTSRLKEQGEVSVEFACRAKKSIRSRRSTW